MEMNNLLTFLLSKVDNFHDSNIENIRIKQRCFSNDMPDYYPKEISDVFIEFRLPENIDKVFSKKIIRVSFFEVYVFQIKKDKNWNWLIEEAGEGKDGSEGFVFFIDDFIVLSYKSMAWCDVTPEGYNKNTV